MLAWGKIGTGTFGNLQKYDLFSHTKTRDFWDKYSANPKI